jgi:hypothetical protein
LLVSLLFFNSFRGRARESQRIFMTDNRYPRYRVSVIKGDGARVLITHKDGYEETWVGFATEVEAEAWIAKQMAKKPQCKS